MMKWLEPWCPTIEHDEQYHQSFVRQLEREVGSQHEMFGVPVRLIARGNGDDALFEILDGSGRVAVVHLVWQGGQQPPWPRTEIYANLQAFVDERMMPEHTECDDASDEESDPSPN